MEHFYIDRDTLFNQFDNCALAKSRDKQISDAVKRLDEDYVLNINESEYVNYLIEEYSLHIPVIHFEDTRIEPKKVLVDPEYLPRYWMADKAVERNLIRYIIPYEGDSNLLNCRPSTWLSSGGGLFHLSSNYIYTDILVIDENAEKVKREFEDRKDSLSKMLGYLESDIRSYNMSLPTTAKRLFMNRKEKIINDNKFLAGLGTPTAAQSQTNRTYSVPSVSRRYPKPYFEKNSNNLEEPTPIMDAQKYSQILDAVHTIGKMYESFPNVTKGMDEETLRDLFLTQIQTSFKADSATGEAFNKKGKTDIMVKHGDGIIFIAECKFWKGKQVFLDAISQLLSYLTWRDTKTALLIFVRDTSMTTAITKAQEAITSHANFKSIEKKNCEAWLNFKFSMPNDADRDVYMAIQFFDYSTKS
ncbi:MAG: hypothetical protein KBS72_02040 [Bacteroidales bacterium]|nr:hypothetical protein [Candidatus Cacconaster scatequi]